jgi:2-amino-4-hydroxy-6-hydroxymethyldihydropteridine diphosphokinase
MILGATVYIGIGSNLGDPMKNCLEAVERIKRLPECDFMGISKWYRTEPVGVDGQNWYMNGAVCISTKLGAPELMKKLLAIEADMGRVRKEKWEARIIDLDILLYSDEIIHEKGLSVPHPLMSERRFVMAPMVDLAPDLLCPLRGKTMIELLAEIPANEQAIEPVKE